MSVVELTEESVALARELLAKLLLLSEVEKLPAVARSNILTLERTVEEIHKTIKQIKSKHF